MKGKERCRALKEIRRQIAEKNDIEYAVSECSFQGECKGTCPKCEAELKYLERQLELRKKLGQTVAIASIATSVCTGLTGCTPKDIVNQVIPSQSQDYDIVGGMADYIPIETEDPEESINSKESESEESDSSQCSVDIDDYEGGLETIEELAGDVAYDPDAVVEGPEE